LKTIVIYKSKSGFVRRYAEWIAEELSADLVENTKVNSAIFTGYDAVIYGGGLYESGINGVKLITDNLDKLGGKRVAVFASGASPARKEALDHIIGHNFTAEQLKQLKFFYLRGGFDYSKLTAIDKMLMTLLKLKMSWKKKQNKKLLPDEIGMLSAYEKPVDFVKRDHIKELVAYIR
jgi:menaquinone-dependent protoporphyrinogen IX oxidase